MDFKFPPFYSLPPFFTLQPVLTTREKQSQLWRDFIISYCMHKKIYELDIDKAEKSELFCNEKINAKLNRNAIIYFIESLIEHGRCEWLDKQKTKCLIYWKTPNEWADIISKWVSENGFTNTLCTVYELLHGETGQGSEFYGLNEMIFRKAIKILEKQGKVQYFQKRDKISDEDGVKFL